MAGKVVRKNKTLLTQQTAAILEFLRENELEKAATKLQKQLEKDGFQFPQDKGEGRWKWIEEDFTSSSEEEESDSDDESESEDEAEAAATAADGSGFYLNKTFRYANLFFVGGHCNIEDDWYTKFVTAGFNTLNATKIICSNEKDEAYTTEFHVNALKQVEEMAGDRLNGTFVCTY